MVRSRADIVSEALEEIAEKEDVLHVLALNDWPVRRSFLVEVTGIRDDLVLRALAKLANAELLEPTDGLTFKLARTDVGTEVRERMGPQLVRQLHEVCLSYGWEHGEIAPGFEIHHLLGAERWDDAAELVAARARGEVSHQEKPLLLAQMKRVVRGLAGEGGDPDAPDDDVARELAVRAIELGIGWAKTRDLQTRLNRLAAIEDLDGELRARLDAADAELAAEKARRKREAAARAEAEAETSEQAMEGSS